jgi:hypothetical protein
MQLYRVAAGMVREGAAAWKSLPEGAKGFDSLELPLPGPPRICLPRYFEFFDPRLFFADVGLPTPRFASALGRAQRGVDNPIYFFAF